MLYAYIFDPFCLSNIEHNIEVEHALVVIMINTHVITLLGQSCELHGNFIKKTTVKYEAAQSMTV